MCPAYAERAFVLKLTSSFAWISVRRGAATDIHWGNWQWLSRSWSQGHPRSDANDSWNGKRREQRWNRIALEVFLGCGERVLCPCNWNLHCFPATFPYRMALEVWWFTIHCTPCQDMATLSRIPRMNCRFWVGFCMVVYFLILFQQSWLLCYRRTGGEICFYPGFVLISVITAANLGHLGRPFFGSLQV